MSQTLAISYPFRSEQSPVRSYVQPFSLFHTWGCWEWRIKWPRNIPRLGQSIGVHVLNHCNLLSSSLYSECSSFGIPKTSDQFILVVTRRFSHLRDNHPYLMDKPLNQTKQSVKRRGGKDEMEPEQRHMFLFTDESRSLGCGHTYETFWWWHWLGGLRALFRQCCKLWRRQSKWCSLSAPWWSWLWHFHWLWSSRSWVLWSHLSSIRPAREKRANSHGFPQPSTAEG